MNPSQTLLVTENQNKTKQKNKNKKKWQRAKSQLISCSCHVRKPFRNSNWTTSENNEVSFIFLLDGLATFVPVTL